MSASDDPITDLFAPFGTVAAAIGYQHVAESRGAEIAARFAAIAGPSRQTS